MRAPMNESILRIGLTGGIGSGKSAVADRFAVLGVPVLDADRIAHELVRPGHSALAEIVDAFGPSLLTADGHLDRGALRERVFAAPEDRKRLERILHPRIHAALGAALKDIDAPYVVLVIPLLLETGRLDLVDRILVVEAPEALRIHRVMDRDGMDAEQIRAIIATQAGPDQRRKAADDLIENRGSLRHLYHRVDRLHRHYLQLAGLSAPQETSR